jgi:hypothetical protein
MSAAAVVLPPQRRAALTGLLAQQAAKQSCLPDAVEERPRRELSGTNGAVRTQLAENRQRFVVPAEEQVTGCLEGRRERGHVPRLDFRLMAPGPRPWSRASQPLTLAVAMATLSWGEGLFDPGKAVGLPPAAGAQAVPERYAHRLGDVGPHPRRQVIPHARDNGEPRGADPVNSGADAGRLLCDEAPDLGVALLVVPRVETRPAPQARPARRLTPITTIGPEPQKLGR